MNNYSKFKEDDIIKSHNLGKALGINVNDIRIIDIWFAKYIERYSQATNFEMGLSYEIALNGLHDGMIKQLNLLSYKYLLPRLIKYHNIIYSGFFKSQCI